MPGRHARLIAAGPLRAARLVARGALTAAWSKSGTAAPATPTLTKF